MNLLSTEILSVSQFNLLIKDVLTNLGTFRIKGEITEMNISSRGGCSITLSEGKSES
jgi:exonuclease VII large subunit